MSADILKRTTIFVKNAEKSADFYRQVFGMTIWMDTPFTLSGNQLAAGRKGDKTRLIIMKANHDTIGMLGLLQWLEPSIEGVEIATNEIRFGSPVFVLAVSDCHTSIKKAEELGAKIFCMPHEWEVIGADGLPKKLLGASFFDPEGYFFEINQIL